MHMKTTAARWAVALIVVSTFSVSAAAQGQEGARRDTTPRTPWGDPDLQGVWEYWTFTGRLARPLGWRDAGH